MLVIQDKLVADEVVKRQFICNLNACKGACCWEGDEGAPLEIEELQTLENIYEKVKPFLNKKGIAAIEKQGFYTYNEKHKEHYTPLVENSACAYMTMDKTGKAQCGIEQAYRAGVTDFYKPISCHLYPIRVTREPHVNFEALNYDEWDICSAACTLGKEKELPVYQFLKVAIVRKYGEDFYEELDAAAQHLAQKDGII
ncbi:MAG: DUF3109 family protein [Saprospiraceae bacterium]